MLPYLQTAVSFAKSAIPSQDEIIDASGTATAAITAAALAATASAWLMA